MPLPQIIIPLGTDHGLTKQIRINDLHIYVNNPEQRIDISYNYEWIDGSGNLFKKEKTSFTLKDYPDNITPEVWGKETIIIIPEVLDDEGNVLEPAVTEEQDILISPEVVIIGRKYLDEWNTLLGATIIGGITSWFE